MIRKAFALGFGCALLMSTVTARVQQQTKIPRIGFLTPQATLSSGGNIAAFRQGLRELGYIEGKNFVIEYRGAEGNLDRMPELAAELVSLGVDIIVTTGMPAVHAAKRSTNTIPIVTATADNLVEAGIVASLARPGGNITGTSRVDADFSAKRVELLKETLPKLSRLAALSHGSLGSDAEELRKPKLPAKPKGFRLIPGRFKTPVSLWLPMPR